MRSLYLDGENYQIHVSLDLSSLVSRICFLALSNHSPIWQLQNIDDVKHSRRTKVPVFDLETGSRSGLKELEVSEDCAVVKLEFLCYHFLLEKCIHLLVFLCSAS